MTRSEIEHARALAETYAPKSTDPLRNATEARSTIELLPRLTLKILDEREALLNAAKEAAEGFDIVAADDIRLLGLLRDAIAKAESP